MADKIATAQDAAPLKASMTDPVLFARHILKDDPWETAIVLFRALDTPNARVAVKGCHSSSKTYSVAEFVLYFLMRYSEAVVITTAPTDRQVEHVMWGEIRAAMARSRLPFPEANLTELKIGPQCYAMGFSTSKGEQAVRFQGYKSAHLLFVLDEAPGIPPEIIDAIEGSAAGGDVRVVMLGNPTIPSGPFYDAFTANREGWACISIDAYDTPNFAAIRKLADNTKRMEPDKDGKLVSVPVDRKITALLRELSADDPVLAYAPRPYLALPSWAKARLREWGETSARWQARVRGQFPLQGEDSLISLAWLEAAREREAKDEGGKVHVGIDVAGPGDDETCIYVRQGPRIIARRSWYATDPRGEVAALLAPYKPRIEELNIDSAGIGLYFAAHFEDLGYPVNYVNVGEAPHDGEQFYLLKAELYWGLRLRFEEGAIAGLTDETTISQLASIRYKHDARGRIVIESKEDARKRGVKSPDRAEALMLCFANVEPGIVGFYRERAEFVAANPEAREIPDADDGGLAKVYEEALEQFGKEQRRLH